MEKTNSSKTKDIKKENKLEKENSKKP